MASVPVVIVGTIKDNDSGDEKQVTITGLAAISGLQAGGGPMPGGKPPIIWGGPIDPYPDIGFPGPQPGGPVHIWGGPYFPPYIWGPTDPRPSNPISGIPGLPGYEPGRKPKIEWKAAWTPETGWIVVGIPTGEHVTPSGEANKP